MYDIYRVQFRNGEFMIPNIYPAGRAATLYTAETDRFKTGLFSVLSTLPITRENAVFAPLLLSVLRRGTQQYPTSAAVWTGSGARAFPYALPIAAIFWSSALPQIFWIPPTSRRTAATSWAGFST